jgi:tetratricopeptide (TPR) repeat protein
LVLLSLRRASEAQATVQRGIELAPAVPQLHAILGTICLDRADWAGAKSAFARALGPGPVQANALYGLGAALMYDNEFAPAAERLQQAVGIDPTFAQAWIHYGMCLLELGEWDKGIACLRRAIAIAPRMYDDALKTLVTTGRGRFPIRPSAAAKLLRPQPQP